MKNYREVADDVFRRSEKVIAANRKRQQNITKVCSVAGGFCLAAVIGVGVWHNGIRPDAVESGSKDEVLIKDNTFVGNFSDTDNAEENIASGSAADRDKIVINKVGAMTSGDSAYRIQSEMTESDFFGMDKEELTAYYGTTVFPEVSEDLHEWDSQYGIYKRDTACFDVTVINYSNDDYSRSISVEVGKATPPIRDYFFFEPDLEKSVIGGVEMMIELTDNGYYGVEFTYNGVSFFICAKGLSQDELVSVVSSFIN